ncbi:substrate-binding periplasmic protein [Propionivibrio soli]|uniref:substrate-binding periplasmic protein n=1 Tax=Propionivibrio soli TaxID=2976531 RepID=UPI0021E96503|nr:ABC transporter substrate-binding protein [Propionivibrio soli]
MRQALNRVFAVRLARKVSSCLGALSIAAGMACAAAMPASAAETVIRYFPVGSIYEYRWRLLQLALEHTVSTDGPFRLVPHDEDITQNRAVFLLQKKDLGVIALGTNEEREARLRPVRVDILRGIVGFRLLLIRSADQAKFARLDETGLRGNVTFGLNSQWADLAIMQKNGYAVVTSTGHENLFEMLAAGRFDAFPRGLNEAQRELDEHKAQFPQLTIERTKALFFPYPVYFWVNKDNAALAARIERGLNMALADGSFRKLFESWHAAEIATMKKERRRVVRLDNPILPAGLPPPDTGWWWSPGDN